MAPRSATLLALVLASTVAAGGQEDATREAAKVSAALAKLTRFTVDVAGTVPAAGGMLGSLTGGSTQRLEASFAVDASSDAQRPRWRAMASVVLPMGGSNVNTVAVQRDGELFVSATLPMPGGQGQTMAFRMPAPAGAAGAGPAQLGPASAGQFTSWLEGQLEKAAPGKVKRTGRTLHLSVMDPSQGREMPLDLTYDGKYLPTRVVVGGARDPKADLRFTNFRTQGTVDTSLPLPLEQYQALSPAMLGGLGGMMGGGAAAAAPSAPARSPFVRPSAAASSRQAPAMPSLQAIPIPGLGGAAPTGQQAQALQGIVSTLTKQLGQAMGPPPPGKQASGIPGLNLSPGTMKLLKHMQKLREGGGSSGSSSSSGSNPAAGLQALTGMLERLGSGDRPGASVNPQSLNKASDTIQQLLQRLRAGQPGAGGGTAPGGSSPVVPGKAPEPLKNPPRRGMSGGRATSAEALERMQELMKKLERTAPVQGK